MTWTEAESKLGTVEQVNAHDRIIWDDEFTCGDCDCPLGTAHKSARHTARAVLAGTIYSDDKHGSMIRHSVQG
jgi:hypothetical protein